MGLTGIKRLGLSLGRIALAAYASLFVLLYFLQETLIFQRQALSSGARLATSGLPDTRELELQGGDGTRLHGWLRHPSGSTPAGLVIYFGGNAEEVSGFVHDADELAPWSVAAFNYRGYGLSEGKPSQAALIADAVAIFDALVARADFDTDRIVVLGRSLGSGVAVQLVHRRPVRGVILVSPFDSLRSIAQREYPFVPVSILLKHPFDSLALASELRAPLLVLAGSADGLIPAENSRRLHDAWAGDKRLVLVPGAGHNDIQSGQLYWSSIRGFLSAR